jgi:group I intron endonuclease
LLKQKKIRTNKENGKSYIGSSADLGARFRGYFSPKHLQSVLDRGESLIYRALLKYGYSSFKLEILEYCEKDKLKSREQYYLDHFKGEYNILSTAGSSLGYQHSEASRQKMREA